METLRKQKINSALQIATRELSYLFVVIAAIYSIPNPPRVVGLIFVNPDIRTLASTTWISMAIIGSLMVILGYFYKLHNLEKGGISIVATVAATLAVLGIYVDTSSTSTLLSILLLAFSFSQANRYYEVTREEVQADFATEMIKQTRGDEL